MSDLQSHKSFGQGTPSTTTHHNNAKSRCLAGRRPLLQIGNTCAQTLPVYKLREHHPFLYGGWWWQALNFALDGARQFSSGKGHSRRKMKICIGTLQRAPPQKHRAPRQLLWVPWVILRPVMAYVFVRLPSAQLYGVCRPIVSACVNVVSIFLYRKG